MKTSTLRILSLCALMATSVCAFGQFTFSGTNPPTDLLSNGGGVMWKVVDDEGGKAIEFRNENPTDFIAFGARLDWSFAETFSKKGFVLRNKIKILPVPGNTLFSYALNAPKLPGIGLTFFGAADKSRGDKLSIGSFDATQKKNVSANVHDAFNRYLDLEAKFVPDTNGGKFTVSVDGTELYSFNIPATTSQRREFSITSGNKDNTVPKAIFLIKDFELKSL